MAKLVFVLNVSLDGYVDHDHPGFEPPGPGLFRHFIELVGGLSGSIYGRRTYELLRYWDVDDPAWTAEQRAFATVWRRQPKWVVSRSLQTVGPNATLVSGDVESVVRDLRARLDGTVEIGGPELAQGLGQLGLVDEYQLYLRPFVLGSGKPYFAGPRPPLRLVANEAIGEDTVRLTYAPA